MMSSLRVAPAAWRRSLLAAAWLVAAACGGAPRQPAPPPEQPTPAAGAGPVQPSDAPLTEQECDALADHLVDLSMTEPRPARADPYTAEDAEAAKRELRTSMRPACGQLTRRQLACALAATSSAALAKC